MQQRTTRRRTRGILGVLLVVGIVLAAAIALVLSLTRTNKPGTSTSTTHVKLVSAVDAQKVIDDERQVGGKPVVIDVRTLDEYASGHLANARNIDVEERTFDAQVSSLDKSKTYVVYCRTDRRSGIATERMKKLGFPHLYDVDGGTVAWTSAGLPIVRDAAPDGSKATTASSTTTTVMTTAAAGTRG